MNHCGTYTIETKRLLLREFMVEDAENRLTGCLDIVRRDP